VHRNLLKRLFRESCGGKKEGNVEEAMKFVQKLDGLLKCNG